MRYLYWQIYINNNIDIVAILAFSDTPCRPKQRNKASLFQSVEVYIVYHMHINFCDVQIFVVFMAYLFPMKINSPYKITLLILLHTVTSNT